jgi:ubiquinone/menaquinone biosynthesis C-methylase UbiE
MIHTRIRPKSEVKTTYDRESLVYNLRRFANTGGRYIDAVEKRLLSIHAKGPSVLEIGTATGRFISFVVHAGWNYTGIDVSKRMLSVARDVSWNGSDHETQPTLLQADGEQLPFSSSSFDTVICLHTFHFLPNPLQCVGECFRVLRKNGTMILIFEMDTWLRRLTLKTRLFESNQFYFTLSEVAAIARSSGFSVSTWGPVLKLPIEAYRKLPMTKIQKQFDESRPFPLLFATLGFVVGVKVE